MSFYLVFFFIFALALLAASLWCVAFAGSLIRRPPYGPPPAWTRERRLSSLQVSAKRRAF